MSSIPAAVDALVAMFRAATPVDVYDGTYPTNPADDYLAVGVADPDNPSVDGTQDWGGLGTRRRHESYDIRCVLSSWSGGGTMKERRDAAFALLTVCETAVKADPSLQGVVTSGWASVSATQVVSGDTPQGPVCTVNFTVTVENTYTV